MEKLDVVNAALAALRAGETCELAVVAGTAGSSPRGVGAWMAVFADGSQAGTIGGGKIELFALDEARELLSAGQSRLVRYTMGGENSDTGMICGGAICLCYLHLDATQAPLFQEIADVLVYRRIGDFVIDFEPFIASAFEGDVAEYHGEESRRTIAGCPGLSLVEEGSKVTYTNAASEIPAAHVETLCPEGLTNITPEMVAELEAHVDDINYEVAIAREKLVRHDVMSHVYAYGQQCPKAAGIIHLGATSCYVGDNTDIIVMRQGLELIRKKLIGVLAKLSRFAEEYKDMPCMAYTHCQPAQPTTVGKRATLWANELVMDLAEIDHRLATLQLRGVKGTTGTQASFMELFKGDADKIRAVDASIAKEMGFAPDAVIPVSGQTYSRKVDAFILNALAGIAQSCMKFATDLRLLANFKEMEEPFEKNQIGSSAMPYKRNPMRCERICALSRYLMVDVLNPSFTTGTQWFERTLDDSANKRVAMAEGFLAADAILNIMLNVTDGIVVYPKVVRSRLMAELPFMASENIMMQAVEKGGNRQELHERLRQHAIAAGKQVKEEGLPNDMVDRVAADPAFGLTKEEIVAGLVPENFVGRAPQQVEEFIANVLQPIFDANPDAVEQHASLSV